MRIIFLFSFYFSDRTSIDASSISYASGVIQVQTIYIMLLHVF